MALRSRTIGIVATLIAVCFSSVGLYFLARDPYSERQIQQLLQNGYNSQRPGSGRLSGAIYASHIDPATTAPELAKAQILLLRQPESKGRRRLQELLYLAAGNWRKFIQSADSASGEPAGPAAINNLGACFLALSDEDPTLLIKALKAFERASKLNPKAPEPLFNLVITYRRLRFPKLAAEAFRQYSAVEPASPWHHELASPDSEDEGMLLVQLERAIESNDSSEAERLFRLNPELWRRVVMQSALSEEPESPDVLRFIANQMEQQYGDKTPSAMVAPLLAQQRDATLTLRDLVHRGAELYSKGKFAESLKAYTQAAEAARKTDSVFDRLWIDLNRVDTEIRLAKFAAARDTLSHLIAAADEQGFLWVKAKALSFYGSSLRLTSSYGEMINLLATADHIFTQLDAPHDRIRILYSLAYYHYVGGDQEEALKLALQCLRLVDDSDSVRLSTLDWLIGSILYRRGMSAESVLFESESVERSRNGPYANGIEFLASTTLAELYGSLSQHEPANQYLKVAEDAFQKVPEGFDHIRYELLLGIVKAKANIDQHKYADAEALLQKNLALYSQQPFSATPLLSQSLTLLAQLYAETGRLTDAAHKFTEAIDVVEKDDEYLESEVFRVKFDDTRRELYDSAIDFEVKHGSVDAAWTYLQKYRAKLFLEFLAAFNPGIEPTRAKLERAGVQERIPRDTQVVEYALLKDRLLIWFVTDKLFLVRSVEVGRNDLETTVQTVLEKLRTEQPVDEPLAQLGKWLIEPISDLLDPSRTITVIPDRALHGLPFSALKRPGKAAYLVEDFAIVDSPSLTYFLATNGAQPSRNAIVGFGAQNGSASEFKELSALANIYPKAATFTGEEVDKSSFLAGLKSAAVFHYAGHSVTDAADPLRSSILLDGNRTGPNSVTAVDISQQHLSTNAVVILSSCDSSVGNSRDGVGVRGLTSAFLIGGAGAVVGSLWPVEAASTAELMIRFHEGFAKSRLPVAQALREAKLTFIKSFPERSHPYYWSGFVVTGNVSALR